MGPAEFRFPVAVKTGTSQDYRDAWTLAYSADVVVGVWVGRADVGPMRGLGGMASAAELAHAVMVEVERARGPDRPDLSFPAPDAHRAAEVCAGGEAGACPAVFHEWVPDEDADATLGTLIDRRTGTLALQSTPREDVIELPAPRPSQWDPMLLRRASASDDAVGVVIAPPEDGAHFLVDPDAPPESNTVAQRARVRGPFKAVTWYVDDEPAGSIAGDEPLHLRLKPGTHRVRARLAGRPESSAVVTIRVE